MSAIYELNYAAKDLSDDIVNYIEEVLDKASSNDTYNEDLYDHYEYFHKFFDLDSYETCEQAIEKLMLI